jgi:tetratricopeptide (TPR) repeat protein
VKAKNSRANMTHFVLHLDAGEDTNAEEGDLVTRQRRHDILHEFMTMRKMRTCFARIFTQAAPGVVRKPSRNAWGVSLIACLLGVPETALAQGGNIGEGPGWMPVLLGIWLGLALIFGTFSVVPLKLLKRRNQSFGLKKAVTGAYLLPLFSTVVAFLVALDRIDSSFIMFLAIIGVIQLIYTGVFWLSEIKNVYKHLRKEGNKNGRRRTTIWLLLGAIALLLLGIVLYLSSRDIGPFHDQTVETYTNRGIAYFDKGDYDAAIKEYTQAITLNPEYAVAYYNRGIAYADKGDDDAAIKDYTQAITLNSEDAKAYHNRGYIYYDKGDYDAALKDYTQVITLNPENVNAYYNRGNAYYAKGDDDAAIKDYTQTITLNPEYAAAYYNRGNAYYDKGDYDAALKDYTQAITLNPEYVDAYNNRGNAYRGKGEYDAAIKDYTQAITLNPEYVNAYTNRGYAYYDKGEYDRAIADYTQAITLNPEYAVAYNDRGYVYNAKGDYDAAIKDLTQAITLNPEYALAYKNRGYAYYDKGEYDRAIADYTQAITLNPEYVNAYTNRGYAYYDKGEYDRAIADYTQAITLNPDYASAYNGLGLALSVQGKYDEAITNFRKALELDPNPVRKANLAELYLVAGHVQEAVSLSQEVLQDPQTDTDHMLAMRFTCLAALLMQGNQADALAERQDLMTYYQGLATEYERGWGYGFVKNFLHATDKLPETDKTLLFKLIEILEAPKPEGDQKLKEFKAWLATLPQQE